MTVGRGRGTRNGEWGKVFVCKESFFCLVRTQGAGIGFPALGYTDRRGYLSRLPVMKRKQKHMNYRQSDHTKAQPDSATQSFGRRLSLLPTSPVSAADFRHCAPWNTHSTRCVVRASNCNLRKVRDPSVHITGGFFSALRSFLQEKPGGYRENRPANY